MANFQMPRAYTDKLYQWLKDEKKRQPPGWNCAVGIRTAMEIMGMRYRDNALICLWTDERFYQEENEWLCR